MIIGIILAQMEQCKKDWKEINSNWYYLRNDGIMTTQWEKSK